MIEKKNIFKNGTNILENAFMVKKENLQYTKIWKGLKY